MGATKIEWASDRWNPITGCPGPKVSPGCDNCYAERMAKRLAGRYGYDADDPFGIHVHHERWIEPFGWKKPRRVFVCTMGDLFHPAVSDSYIAMIFAMAAHLPQHTFILLTKRPQRMLDFISDRSTLACDRRGFAYQELARDAGRDPGMDGLPWPLENVWLGVTVCNQQEADAKIPVLLATPAAKRFVSVEPMLGEVDLTRYLEQEKRIYRGDDTSGFLDYEPLLHWVICGGETGHRARPMHTTWVRGLRDHCQENGVPFFFKSWGEWYPRSAALEGLPANTSLAAIDPDCKEWPCVRLTESGGNGWDLADVDSGEDIYMQRIGKKRAGRLLDGREWNEVPE